MMTYSDLLDIFKNTYPFMKVTNYRPVCHELFEDGKEGCTIWLDNGDMVVYYPNQERGDAVNEMMTFPDTWEEYEKSYGFTDNEEVYTNGARLIPSFRVKQWLDHLLSVKSRMGKWIKDNPHSEIYRYACSECHAHHRARYDFCPSCGADMRSEAREYLEYGKLIAKGIAQGLRGDSE